MRINQISEVAKMYQANRVMPAEKVAHNKKDELQISTQAMEYQKTKQMLDRVPDIRVDKVEELKQRIEAGTYNVSAKDVAAKMIRQFGVEG